MNDTAASQPTGHRTRQSPPPSRDRETAGPATPIHVSFLIDRSGSMRTLQGEVVSGFNAFLAEQRARSGECNLTVVQFDSEDPFEVIHEACPVRDVPDLTADRYRPRAATPLLDAIGRLVEQADARLKGLGREEDQIVGVFTDGLENASRDWSREKLFAVVEERKRAGWTFVFMGANQDSYAEGGRLGFDRGSVQDFRGDPQGAQAAFGSFNRAVREYRAAPSTERARRRKAFFAGRKEAEADHRGRMPTTPKKRSF